MSPKLPRRILDEHNFFEMSFYEVEPDLFKPHGLRFRLAWVQDGKCRVLFDNHHGKADHYHVDGEEFSYVFASFDQLQTDFISLVRKLGGPL